MGIIAYDDPAHQAKWAGLGSDIDMRRPLPLLRLRLLFARRLLPLPSLLFVVHPRDDVGVLHLMLQLVVPRGHVFRQRLRPPHLPRLLGRLGTFELAAL